MPKCNLVEAINLGLKEEMEKDPAVMILGEDVGREGGVFRVTDGLQAIYGPDRVVDTPLAESGIVGTAFGLALNGMRPIAEIQFEGFLPPTLDQIISHVSRIRTRSRGRHSCPMVIRSPYGGGIRAPEHHSDANEALFAHIPGIKVVIPSNPYDAKGLIISAIRDPDPVLFLEPKRIYRAVRQEIPDGEYTVPTGEAAVVQEGDSLTVICWGAMVREVLRAAEAAAAEGINAEVVDLRTISPMDDETIMDSVRKTGRVVVVHEAPKTCGVGAEIIARINEKAFYHLEGPMIRVTGFDTVMPLPKLENIYLPDQEKILRAMRQVVEA